MSDIQTRKQLKRIEDKVDSGSGLLDSGGNDVSGTSINDSDVGDQQSPPLGIYLSVMIEPVSTVTYQGITYSNKFQIKAEPGRFTPDLTGAITGNYKWGGMK